MSRLRFALVCLCVAGAAVVGGLVACGLGSVTSAKGATPSPTEGASSMRTVVAIGDSIMDGHGLDPSQAWPVQLAGYNGWRMINLATDGAGFVSVGDNGTIFADQVDEAVRLDPQSVILAGSSNDLGESESAIEKSMVSAMDTLHSKLPHTTIIAVSPVWNEKQQPSQLDLIDDDLASAVKAVGGHYIEIGQPLLNKPGMMQGDDVHPTAAGQLVIAAAVQEGLRKQHLV